MRYLGLDLGTKTLGISISDTTKTVATSMKTLRHDMDFNYLIDELKDIINGNNIEKIILGLPKNMNNTIGERAEMVLEFKKQLEQSFSIPVILEDERLTTRIAENILINADMTRKKRKKVIDKMAANVILQSYLDKEGKK
ncbi:MAG TPA: Holliday junction resolvase RuvX [Bacilli bacterium]|nr:Holliday junction resolvase RuvX [Bacilli bacterium]